MPPRRRDGRRRLPSNAVFRAIQAAGGPSAVCRALGVSLPTLARWRRAGRVSDPEAVLTWAALVHPEAEAQLALAWALAGVRWPRRR
jgi:DNA-binding transcriptional regulator YdaS (Cro superfamily)